MFVAAIEAVADNHAVNVSPVIREISGQGRQLAPAPPRSASLVMLHDEASVVMVLDGQGGGKRRAGTA